MKVFFVWHDRLMSCAVVTQGKSALNTITCVVFDGYSTNISESYATQQDAIHEVRNDVCFLHAHFSFMAMGIVMQQQDML
jgi:hypothetical protein